MKKIYILFLFVIFTFSFSSTNEINISAAELRTMFVVSAESLHYSQIPKYKFYMFFKNDLTQFSCKDKIPNSYWMIDHEGGFVKRFNSKLAPADIFINDEINQLKIWNEDALYLKQKCINIVLGPVLDTNLGPHRSYSDDIQKNLIATEKVNSILTKNKIYSVLKHFPGFTKNCKSWNNSYEISLCNETEYELINEWKYFKTNNFAKMIMISNYYYKNIDNKTTVLSPKIYDILENKLNYHGLIVTDAINEWIIPPTNDDYLFLLTHADIINLYNPRIIEKLIKDLLPIINGNEKTKIIIRNKINKINSFFP